MSDDALQQRSPEQWAALAEALAAGHVVVWNVCLLALADVPAKLNEVRDWLYLAADIAQGNERLAECRTTEQRTLCETLMNYKSLIAAIRTSRPNIARALELGVEDLERKLK